MKDLLERLARALSDRYAIEDAVSAGGMAVVYRARDLRHGRTVAIKVLRPDIAAAIGTDRFLQEIQFAARLFHPHILMLIDSGTADGLLYYVMPYVDGESLRDRIDRDGKLALDSAVTLTAQCAGALAYAHEQGVVHRDIKPENILFEAGHAVISDFGIARALQAAGGERLTRSGVALGTPAYISPEQAAGESNIGPAADIYALGLVLYECLAGHPPFHGGSAQSIIARHVTELPTPVSALRPDTPPHVADAVQRALRKDPSERFASAADFGAALGPRLIPVTSRRRKVATAAILGAVLVVAVLTGSLLFGRFGLPNEKEDGIAPGASHRLTQLTSAAGVEQWPAWSPNGKRVAFIGESDQFRKIFVRDMETGEDRQATTGARDDIQPAWSADGSRLAFVRATTPNGKLEPGDINGWYNEGGDIWVLDLAKRREARIVENAFGPSFAPDGNRLAFDAGWSGARRIWISDGGGRNPRPITTDSSEAVVHSEAAWSPNGRLIAFRRIEKAASDIGVVDVATQQVHWITRDNVLDMNPTWSPSGDALYFSSARGGGINIWRVRMSVQGERASELQQLTTGAGDDITPAPSPDGRRLAFIVRGFDSDLWRLPVEPVTGRQRAAPDAVSRTTRVESRGAWSPDMARIAFNSDRRGDMNLWIRELSNGAERQLTRGSGGDYQANWSPDGRMIAFFSARSGNADIWSVPVSGGSPVQLTTDRATDTNPFYSPDGRLIAFMSDRRARLEVWVMNADGTSQRPVSDLRAGGHFIAWGGDSRSVVFSAETASERKIVQVSLVDGAMGELPPIVSGAHMSWSPNHRAIMDVRGHKDLWVHPLDGRAPYQIFDFRTPDVRVDYPVWSPDGRWVLFDRAQPSGGDVWMLQAATGRSARR